MLTVFRFLGCCGFLARFGAAHPTSGAASGATEKSAGPRPEVGRGLAGVAAWIRRSGCWAVRFVDEQRGRAGAGDIARHGAAILDRAGLDVGLFDRVFLDVALDDGALDDSTLDSGPLETWPSSTAP